MNDKKNRFSRKCYRILRRAVRFCYPEIQTEGTENLPEEPCIIVANHAQMHGPLACELHYPRKRAIWCAAQMMYRKEVAAYAYRDFWSGKPRTIRWLYKILSHLIVPLSVCIFNNANTVPVYHDVRLVSTFRQTEKHLDAGDDVIIFPECAVPHGVIVNQFQDRFIDIARHYEKRTGKALAFVPMYIAPKLRKMYIGAPVRYRPEANAEEERRRICTELMERITALGVALPQHRVVPYCNVSKKQYPLNRPNTPQMH